MRASLVVGLDNEPLTTERERRVKVHQPSLGRWQERRPARGRWRTGEGPMKKPIRGSSTMRIPIALAAISVCSCVTAVDGAAEPRVDRGRVEALTAEYRLRAKDPSWASPAKALRRAGDDRYLRRDYSGAQQQYRDAYPNLPESYSFVMAADSQLRAVLEWNEPHSANPAQCMRSRTFADDLRTELSQVYSMGMAMADATGDKTFKSSYVYRRAKDSEVCLWNLLKGDEATRKDDCFDLSKLKTCLGDPFLKRP
jgi:hypothetical protein